MAKKEESKKGKQIKDYYAIKDNKLERKNKNCPKCGEGVFLAEHKDRVNCGKCGYTEFKKK